MNRFLLFIILFTTFFAVTGCAPPIGSINGGGSSGKYDDFWAVPKRQYYFLGHYFIRDSDLQAFVSYRGIVELIPASKLEISLVKNPDDRVPDDPIPILNGKWRLVDSVVETGRKLIIVKYGDRTDEYSIEIRNLDDGRTDPNGDDEGSGIGIIWR
jgi:hypothetical protein